jgi:primosomal protein N' (replication factor Y)
MNEDSTSLAGHRTKVLLLVPLAAPLDYLSALPLAAGTYVKVPLAGRLVNGIVWDDSPKQDDKQLPLERLKMIDEILAVPPLAAAHRRFVEWVANYTLSSPGAVLRMTLNVPTALREPPTRRLYFKGDGIPARLTEARHAVLAVTADGEARTAKGLAAAAGVSEAVVRGLAQVGALIATEAKIDQPFSQPDPSRAGPKLTPYQAEAADVLRRDVRAQVFQPSLLEGVTGSGKTEVYFEVIAEALHTTDHQILVLLPEIALTSQWLKRFSDRFGAEPIEWHSDLSMAQRRRAWRAIAEGQARIVVGARSALFLPFQGLSLIVIDEEHDTSFKQEEGVLYNARDMAVVRASLEDAPIILASATPSLETVDNVARGKYARYFLPHRHGAADLPEIEAIDMRVDGPPAGRWISPILEDALRAALDRDEQGLLFLNRRGYAPLTLCRACGERIDCPNCSAWLVEHRYRQELQCHHCGHAIPSPEKCPSCGVKGKLVPSGPGVERLEEEIKTLFPEARLLVMTSDTVTSPKMARQFVAKIESLEVDIIIGTQIVTKGYHFPRLTCVGVVDADLGLRGGDLRAGERTFQQLEQVAGRAGRGDRPGHVYMQTFMPEHPVAQALLSGNREEFVAREMAARRKYEMPPFGRLAALIISGPKHERVRQTCNKLRQSIQSVGGFQVLGPVPAPLARLKGQFRYRFLIRSKKTALMQDYLRRWLIRCGPIKGARVKVDIDPQSFV